MICRDTGKETKILITIQNTIHAENTDILQRIEDYQYNPQHGQTILKVIGDEKDEFANWHIADIKCLHCQLSMSKSAALSHFMTPEQFAEYERVVLGEI
jgi:hypothetical protein